jgi:hypothetical protein
MEMIIIPINIFFETGKVNFSEFGASYSCCLLDSIIKEPEERPSSLHQLSIGESSTFIYS